MLKRKLLKFKNKNKELCEKIVNGKNELSDEIILLNRIGTKSVDGEVFKACYMLSCKKQIAVKKIHIDIPKKEQEYILDYYNEKAVNSSSIWSELLFLKAATELVKNKICPNFPMYFNNYICKNCDNKKDDTCMYIVNELANGDLKMYLNTYQYTFDDLMSCYYQIFMALYCIKKQYNLFHNDLHFGNVLFHNLDNKETKYWEYSLENNEKITIPIYSKLFVLWDFGRSTIQGKVQPKDIKKMEIDNHLEDFDRIIHMLVAFPEDSETNMITKEQMQFRNKAFYIFNSIIQVLKRKNKDYTWFIKMLPKLNSNDNKIQYKFNLVKKNKSSIKYLNEINLL
jgi:hypothetical protein